MTRKIVLQRILPACFLGYVLIFNVALISVLSHYDKHQVSARDASTYVSVGEIYNHPANVQLLYDLIAGESNVTYEQIYALTGTKHTASDFRFRYYGKAREQNIQVTFGGLAWQVCYLSLTGKDGDANRTPILTLLLADTNQLSRFQTWQTIDDFDTAYPSNLYGTSYVRAVTLNNGGQYATGRDTLATAIQDEKNPFAIFTMDGIEGSVTDAIVKPSQVAWQENQSAIDYDLGKCNYFNEAWGIPNNDSSESMTVDYRNKAFYDVWKDDYLWLPSYTEIGNREQIGIWHLHQNQRRCGKQYWLRSVYPGNTYGVGRINTNGRFEHVIVDNGGGYVLPALHLNLNAAALRVK